MPKGWNANVYRTDVEPEQFIGFHFDASGAQSWIDKQEEGTYEVSTEGPAKRQARLGAATATEEAARD